MSGVRDGLLAGAVAAIPSGAPSTVHAVLTGTSPFEATYAAGTLLAPRRDRPPAALAGAGIVAHVALSLGWGAVLGVMLPRSRGRAVTVACGGLAGLAIAALDLGVVGRRFPRIRALPRWPQVADHVAFGVIVGAVVATRERRVR